MKRTFGVILVSLVVISLLVSACATAPTPTPTKAPAAPTKASEAPKATTPAATKAPSAAATPAGQAAKPAASKGPAKIGYIASFTGSLAQNGIDMRDGFSLYLELRGGQLGGHKVDVLFEDDESKPDVGLTKAKKLVERDNVDMLAGFISSAVTYSVAEYAKAQKKVMFINMAGSDDVTQKGASPYLFRSSSTGSHMNFVLGDWAYKKGYRNAVLLASDFAAGYEQAGGFARVFAEAGGKVIQELYPPLGGADPAAFITTIKPEADVVYAFQAAADALRFVPMFDQYGVKKRATLVGGWPLTDDAILDQQGDSALGTVVGGFYNTGLDNAANQDFKAAFKKKFNRDAGPSHENGWTAALILDKALESVSGSTIDQQALIAALEKVDLKETPRGPLKFDKYHNPVENMYIAEVKKVNGKLVNSVIETYPAVSQFWKWSPEEYLKMPSYTDMKGKWAK